MADSTVSTRQPFNWRLFGVLCALNLLGSLAVLPYAQTIQRAGASAAPAATPGQLILTQIVNAVLVNWPLAAIGLLLAVRLGLGAPVLAGWLRGDPVRGRLWKAFLPALVVGFLVLALAVKSLAPGASLWAVAIAASGAFVAAMWVVMLVESGRKLRRLVEEGTRTLERLGW